MDQQTAAPAPADTAAPVSFFGSGLDLPEEKPAAPSAPSAAPEPKPAAAPVGRILASEDMRANPSLAKFLDAEGKYDPDVVLKSYVHSQSLIGADKIVLPKEGDEKGWNDVWNRLGRPESADKYEFKKPEQMPDGMIYDEEGEKFLRSFAHANGLTQKQAAAAYETLFKREQERMAAWKDGETQRTEEAVRALHREHGPGAKGFIDAANVAMGTFGNDSLRQKLTAAGLQNDPDIIRAFGAVGKQLIGETKLRGQGVDLQPSKAEIQAKLASFRSEHSAALYDSSHPDHRQRVKQLTDMTNAVYGGG